MAIASFFIIGAPKCGTTSLQAYLNQHPDICFSKYKEPNYFAFAGEKLPKKGPVSPKLMQELIYFHSLTEREEYEAQFSHHQGEKVLGDASVRYLYIEPSAQRIKESVPKAKMVAVLREPVSRLYSHYCMNKQYQLEPLELLDAIEAEPERIKDNWGWDWHYINIGLYSTQIQRYYNTFSKNQLKIFLYDDFQSNPHGVIKSICEFLDIDSDFSPDISKRGKVAYWPKNLVLDRWLTRSNPSRNAIESIMPRKVKGKFRSLLYSLNSAPIPKLQKHVADRLKSNFTEDVSKLEALLEREIPWYK